MICVSIGEIDIQTCAQTLKKCEMAELRLDLIALNPNEIKPLFGANVPTIATCREGVFNNSSRMALLKSAIDSGANYVDIEFESEENYRDELIEYAKQKGCKVIISYHNFTETPETSVLKKIVKQSKKFDADVVKIVTTANSKDDNIKIFSLYENTQNIVAFAMGKLGKISRIASVLLGAPFTYASLNEGHEVANGQISQAKMNEILKILR